MVTLSIHLITYNNEKHIEETLQSILKQKVDFKYEIVVGDDCSTDNTFNILSTYVLKRPDVFKVQKNKKQLGILRNFKVTLDRCSGIYIFDIAGDDLLKHDNALQKMVDVLKNDSSLGFVDSGYDRFNDKINSVTVFKNNNQITSSKKTYKEEILLGKVVPIGHCFNREYLYKYVDFDTYLKMKISVDDYPILVDLIMNSNFSRINESLHTYRVHDNSHSHKKELDHLLFQKNEMKHLFDYFSNKYKFSEKLKSKYQIDYNKDVLFLTGYFENKTLGKEIFLKTKSKGIKDWIHFWASQSKRFRKLISLKKKLLK
ncbi:MAG: hypothetical protein DRI75_05220 [Bacteroidetes bacterium]|nr:MAG: hypothetical protein DRI75_05220 [Bacteroidota bacterium]